MNTNHCCLIINNKGRLIDSGLPRNFVPDVSSAGVLFSHITDETDREHLKYLISSGGNPFKFRLSL